MPRYGNYEYERVGSGVKITGYNGYGLANIPAMMDGLPVREIGGGFIGAFQNCEFLRSVTIPNSVTSVGNRAFLNCSSLTSITIPHSVTHIGSSAFSGCSSLTNIIIPDSVTEIGNSAFYGCKSLKSIKIPDSITEVVNLTFCDCTLLESVSLSDSITYIGVGAFQNCTSLTSIVIPDSVTEFGGGKITSKPFLNCSCLRDIYLPESLRHTPSVIAAVEEARNQSNCRIHYYNLPTVFFNKINHLKELSGISSEYIAWVEEIKSFIESKKYNRDMKNFIAKILNNIETVHKIQQELLKKSSSEVCPYEFIRDIARLKNLPNITSELSALLNQLNILIKENYVTELNDSVEKILDNIWTLQRKMLEITPRINLIALVNTVSDKKITNALLFFHDFDNGISKIESGIKTDLEALAAEKNAIQNRRNAPQIELENRIKADIETLIFPNSAKQNQTGTTSDFKYTRIKLEIQIDKYVGHDAFVAIPEHIEGLPVTTIGYKAFDNPDLRKVVIPASVNTIVYGGFVSKQSLHVLFNSDYITLTPQSFIAPEVIFYFTNVSIAQNLYYITKKNNKYRINYSANSF